MLTLEDYEIELCNQVQTQQYLLNAPKGILSGVAPCSSENLVGSSKPLSTV